MTAKSIYFVLKSVKIFKAVRLHENQTGQQRLTIAVMTVTHLHPTLKFHSTAQTFSLIL